MSGKDLLKLLLISYGFSVNIEISTYRGEGGCIGYDVSAESQNKNEPGYHEVDCEGLQFHIYEILNFMHKNEIKPKTIVNAVYSTSDLLKMTNEELSKLQF